MGTPEKHVLNFASLCICVYENSVMYHHSFDFGSLTKCPIIVVLCRGTGEFRQVGRTITAEPGDLVYIPMGTRYHSVWRGTPDIHFFSFHVVSDAAFHNTEANAPLQRIDALSGSDTISLVQELYRIAAGDDAIEKLHAISRFIRLYADVQSHLCHEPPVQYHSALFAAMKYIEENYARNFTMQDLEKVTFVGESRLYHLFQTQLRTTPLKFRNRLRIERAAELLITSELSIEAVAAEAGFSSFGYFRQSFKEYTGLSPFQFRRNRQHAIDRFE